jgi:hypothetical protein
MKNMTNAVLFDVFALYGEKGLLYCVLYVAFYNLLYGFTTRWYWLDPGYKELVRPSGLDCLRCCHSD